MHLLERALFENELLWGPENKEQLQVREPWSILSIMRGDFGEGEGWMQKQ
jgi:hypothetical protein